MASRRQEYLARRAVGSETRISELAAALAAGLVPGVELAGTMNDESGNAPMTGGISMSRRQHYMKQQMKQMKKRKKMPSASDAACAVSPLISEPLRGAGRALRHPLETLRHPIKHAQSVVKGIRRGYGNENRESEGLAPMDENGHVSLDEAVKHHARAEQEHLKKSKATPGLPGLTEAHRHHAAEAKRHGALRRKYDEMRSNGHTHVGVRQYDRDQLGKFASFSGGGGPHTVSFVCNRKQGQKFAFDVRQFRGAGVRVISEEPIGPSGGRVHITVECDDPETLKFVKEWGAQFRAVPVPDVQGMRPEHIRPKAVTAKRRMSMDPVALSSWPGNRAEYNENFARFEEKVSEAIGNVEDAQKLLKVVSGNANSLSNAMMHLKRAHTDLHEAYSQIQIGHTRGMAHLTAMDPVALGYCSRRERYLAGLSTGGGR